MAATWISWRSVDRVREVWPEYRAKCPDRESIAPTAWELLTREEKSLYRHEILEGLFEDLPPRPLSLEKARRELWFALSNDSLSATAEDGDSELVSIPAGEWAYLHLDECKSLDVLRNGALGKVRYRKIRLNASGLLRLWPPMATEGTAADGNSPLAEKPKRRSPEQDRVRPYLEKIWGGEIPDRSSLPDVPLEAAVADAMKKDGKTPAKRDTILRAAGRAGTRQRKLRN